MAGKVLAMPSGASKPALGIQARRLSLNTKKITVYRAEKWRNREKKSKSISD